MAPRACHSGLRRDIRELSVAVVAEEDVALPHAGDEQVGVAVVVDVGERGADTRAIADRDAGALGDVCEATAAEIAVQTVLANLVDEVEIEQSVAVDVGNRDRGTVVVVRRPIVLSEIDAAHVLESDTRSA